MTDPHGIPVSAAGVTARSGTLTITDVDPAAWELFTTPPRVLRAAVRVQSFDPIRCPSPWRHPIAWLRWNPFLARRVTMVLHDCEIEPGDGGSVNLIPHPVGPEPPDFEFEAAP